MPNIHVLDQNTINKIAAGEVIERPASVVKELLENAIDARATAVTVEIRDGGISLIRVTDNGCGIPKEELPLAFLRHSTSKIQSVEDLFTVSSLGFRGEALSSIAAVSQVEVVTKTGGTISGYRYQIEGGAEKGLEEIGAPDGTTFIARNLFYNTPVRRKFLKTAATEGAHVADLVEKIALSHPEISIRFIQNNQNKLHTSGNHNLKDIIYTVYGRDITANLLPVEHQSEMISIRGFIGKPVIARSNRNFENYFINGRYIKSGIVYKAIEEAYKPFMMQHKYPFTMLHFAIEPEYLDVNVHPTKMELRFRDGEVIFRAIRDAIAEALREKELIPEVVLDEKKQREEEAKELRRLNQEKRIPVPEPFEKRRMAQMRGEDAEKESSAETWAKRAGLLAQPMKTAEYRSGRVEAPDKQELPWESGTTPQTGQARRIDVFGLRKDPGIGLQAAGKEQSLRPKTQEPGVQSEAQNLGMQLQPEPQYAGIKEPAEKRTEGQAQWKEEPAQYGTKFGQRCTVSAKPDTAVPKAGHQTIASEAPEPSEAPEAPKPSEALEPSEAQKPPEHPAQLELFSEKLLEPTARIRHKLIGQLFDTYWLVEFNDQLYIIDQHAAHEKVLYEKTMASLENRQYTSQMVDPPIILTLGSQEEEMLCRHMKYFTDIGFEIEPFGGREYAVRGVPDNLFAIARKDLLLEMLDSLTEDTLTGNPQLVYEKVASMSCKAAVKGNHHMSSLEADKLIDQLLTLENPYACPHGRPTIISMSRYELEKKFKRIV